MNNVTVKMNLEEPLLTWLTGADLEEPVLTWLIGADLEEGRYSRV